MELAPQIASNVTNVSDVGMTSLLKEMAYGYRILFYLMRPSETQFKTVEEVPSYLLEVSNNICLLVNITLCKETVHISQFQD